MTELLTRPPAATATVAADDGAASSLWWRGSLAALWAVAVGVAILMVAVLVVWATDSRSGAGAGSAIRISLAVWLAAHKVPLHVDHGTVAVAPLGLTLALAFVVARAAAVLARGHEVDSPSGVASIGLAVGVPYAVLTAFVAAAAHSSTLRPSPAAALLAGLALGCTAATWGAARGTGSLARLRASVPAPVAAAAPAAGLAVATVVVAGMVLTLGSLAVHARGAADLADGLGGGVVANFALLVVDALLLPNAAVTVIGYLSGPGFAVGAGTSVSLGGAHVGTTPSLPLIAAVPHGPAPGVVRVAVIAVLLLAGAAMGWRADRDARVWAPAAVGRGLLAAAIAGALTAVLVGLAGGPAGPGRMATVGASPWQVGLVLAGELGFVATATVLALRWQRRS